MLVAARRVPGSDWFAVAKIDKAEAYAPLRDSGTLILAITRDPKDVIKVDGPVNVSAPLPMPVPVTE